MTRIRTEFNFAVLANNSAYYILLITIYRHILFTSCEEFLFFAFVVCVREPLFFSLLLLTCFFLLCKFFFNNTRSYTITFTLPIASANWLQITYLLCTTYAWHIGRKGNWVHFMNIKKAHVYMYILYLPLCLVYGDPSVLLLAPFWPTLLASLPAMQRLAADPGSAPPHL